MTTGQDANSGFEDESSQVICDGKLTEKISRTFKQIDEIYSVRLHKQWMD